LLSFLFVGALIQAILAFEVNVVAPCHRADADSCSNVQPNHLDGGGPAAGELGPSAGAAPSQAAPSPKRRMPASR